MEQADKDAVCRVQAKLIKDMFLHFVRQIRIYEIDAAQLSILRRFRISVSALTFRWAQV